jgi:hypothetical protein
MDFLEKNPQITRLCLQEIIDPEVMRLLMSSLAGNKTVTRLDLRVRNGVGAKELAGNTTLQVLRLNLLPTHTVKAKGDELIEWFAALNNMPNIEALWTYGAIDVETAQLLVNNKTLRYLYVHNPIRAMVFVILAKNQSITHLELSCCDSYDMEVFEAWEHCDTTSAFEALKNNITLERLTVKRVLPNDIPALAENKNLINLAIGGVGGPPCGSLIRNEMINELLCNQTLMRLTIEVGCSQEQQELMDTLAKHNKGLQIEYAKGCKKLLSDSFPRVLVEIMFGYVFSPQRCALMGIEERLEEKEPAQAQIVVSSQRAGFFYNQNAAETQKLKYKTGGLIVLTVGSAVGIFYLWIAGTAAICIPIVLCVASMYYGFSLYQNHSERGALELPGMASP